MSRLRTLTPHIVTLDTRTKPPPKTAAPFYLTPEWRALITRLLSERGRECEKCGAKGCRIYGDHIHELKDGGPALDPSNIQLLCPSCHTRKTVAVRAKRQGARIL